VAFCPSAVVHQERQYADEDPLLAGKGCSVCEAAFEYHPRRPEESVLYHVVAENIESLPDGRLLYRLKRRWSDGTTHVIYEPMELMERLAALVPPPRFNITRFYGVLAPTATFRPLIVPNDKTTIAPTHQGCPAKAATPITDAAKTDTKRSRQLKNYSWARLMMRVFELDVLSCVAMIHRIAIRTVDGRRTGSRDSHAQPFGASSNHSAK
jgi:hypothetical protein